MLANLPSRAELLAWVSDLTKVKVEKLQHLSDAIQFCQIFDIIYPKIVPLNKLKKDAKGSLEKQKNFRILLNAISQLHLKVTINIIDLASGKVTAILELLQWLWKEYQKPSLHNDNRQGKDSKQFETRMIKSYVGKLVTRPNLSLAKKNQRSEASKSIGSGRRSLDARLSSFPKTQKSDGKSVKTAINPIHSVKQKSFKGEGNEVKDKVEIKFASGKKSQKQKANLNHCVDLKEEKMDVSQTKDLTVFIDQPEKLDKKFEDEIKKSPKSSKSHSKTWVINDPDSLNKIYSEKKENIKKLKADKESGRKVGNFNVSEIIESTFGLSREKLCQKLIKITGAVLQSNPELESKLKKLLSSSEDSSKQKNHEANKSCSNKHQSINSSDQDTSLRCQSDTILSQDIDIDGPSTNNVEQTQKNEVVVEPSSNLKVSIFANKQIISERKNLNDKTSSKPKDTSSDNQIILPHQVAKQITTQKENTQTPQNEEKIQKPSENLPLSCMALPNSQRSINIFQNLPLSGINYFTHKKNEPNGHVFTSKKKPQSENPNLARLNDNNQNEVQNQENQKESKKAKFINTANDERNDEELKYPELDLYNSVIAPKHSSSDKPLFY